MIFKRKINIEILLNQKKIDSSKYSIKSGKILTDDFNYAIRLPNKRKSKIISFNYVTILGETNYYYYLYGGNNLVYKLVY